MMISIFRASSSTALKTGVIVSWKSLHGLRNTLRTQVTVQPRLHIRIEALCEHPEMLLGSAKVSSK